MGNFRLGSLVRCIGFFLDIGIGWRVRGSFYVVVSWGVAGRGGYGVKEKKGGGGTYPGKQVMVGLGGVEVVEEEDVEVVV